MAASPIVPAMPPRTARRVARPTRLAIVSSRSTPPGASSGGQIRPVLGRVKPMPKRLPLRGNGGRRCGHYLFVGFERALPSIGPEEADLLTGTSVDGIAAVEIAAGAGKADADAAARHAPD